MLKEMPYITITRKYKEIIKIIIAMSTIDFRTKVQRGFIKAPASPNAFLTLPRSIVNDITLFTGRGARLESALLSALAFHYKRNLEHTTLKYQKNDKEIDIEENTCIVSILTLAEDLWCRTFPELEANLKEAKFKTFYNCCTRAVHRLCGRGYATLINQVGYKGLLGTVWALGKEVRQHLDKMHEVEPNANIMPADIAESGDYVNAVDIICSNLREDYYKKFNRGEICKNVRDRGRFWNRKEWIDAIAGGECEGDALTTVGAFKEDATISAESECTIPHVTLDIDRENLEDAHRDTLNILEFNDADGCDLNDILVSFSGNRGFHVQYASGMFANPVFRNAAAAVKIQKAFAENFEVEIDHCVFNPRHLLRMTGAQHPKTGLYKTTWTATEFLKLNLTKIVEQSRIKRKYVLPDPYSVKKSSVLTQMLSDAEKESRKLKISSFSDALNRKVTHSGAYAKALQGCEESEVWHENHCGRNKCLFMAAHYYFSHYDNHDALKKINAVNQLCSPPLSSSELRGCINSAKRKAATNPVPFKITGDDNEKTT